MGNPGGGDLLGAFRLPNTAFRGNAGTDVVSDVLFLRKRAPGTAVEGEAFKALAQVEAPEGTALINEYYKAHPAQLVGELHLIRRSSRS